MADATPSTLPHVIARFTRATAVGAKDGPPEAGHDGSRDALLREDRGRKR